MKRRKVLTVKARRICFALPLLLLMTAACNRGAAFLGSSSTHASVDVSTGDYLSTKYIERLKSTRSPFEAGKAGGVDLVVVTKGKSATEFMPIFNFHEGGAAFALNEDGSLKSLDGAQLSKISFALIDQRTFRFTHEGAEPATYSFVGNADRFIAKAVLAGRFKDQRGRSYEFGEDGWAVFPDNKFKYEVGTDRAFRDFDYFIDTTNYPPGDAKVFAFKWQRGVLQVFRTAEADGVDEVIDEVPYLSLRPVKP